MGYRRRLCVIQEVTMTGKKTKYSPAAYGYIAPISIILIVFVGISLILSVVLSFSKYNILLPPEFNGIENYHRLLTDQKFLTALTNTLKLLVYIVPPPDGVGVGGLRCDYFQKTYFSWKTGKYCNLYPRIVFERGGGHNMESYFKRTCRGGRKFVFFFWN